jgi:hypothetical protein
MQAVRHAPAYVMPLQGAWRVIVPIRGRLSPQVLAPEFATKAAAAEWLDSPDWSQRLSLASVLRRRQIS